MKKQNHKYVGSIILGINDALIELTGALAGLTLILQNTKLIAIASFITGLAASMSMAASEYFETKSENTNKNPKTAAIYTGIAYIFTVLILILPFIVLNQPYFALTWTVLNAIIIIYLFTHHISKDKTFKYKITFTEMLLISLGIATLTFFIGFIIKTYLEI